VSYNEIEALCAFDRNGCTGSEQTSASRLKPFRGAEGGLDTLIGSEKTLAVAIDGLL
jgi:hypothetical protein